MTPIESQTPLFDGRRPARIDPPPTGGEVKKLRERLLKFSADDGRGFTEPACEFLAASVVNPPGVRGALARPTMRPTATGYLETIRATVPIDVLTPDPANGRVVGATAWPAADLDDDQTLKLWAPADMVVYPNSSCEILLTGDSLDSIKRVIEDAAEHTKSLNKYMKDKVERDGILDPLLCQIAHVQTLDGQRGISLLTRDGSTRCSYAKQAHGASAHDAFFGAARDVDWRRQRWAEMRRLSESPMDTVTPEHLIELRTFLVDVEIVVGFHSTIDGSRATALDAVDDIVRRIHVEVTHPWLPVAQSNSEADQVLGALRHADLIGHDEFLLYGGKLPRSQRAARDLPLDSDAVVAALMIELGAGDTPRSRIEPRHVALRSIDFRGRVTNRWKAQMAGTLGLRQFDVPSTLLGSAHLALGEGLALESLWIGKWDNTDRGPDALRDAALAELADGDPGPTCRELVVKAAGHMAAQGWLRRESRDPHGGFRDQRPPDTVLDLMHRSEQGVHALAEALIAGRRGEAARAVRGDGEPLEQVGGDLMLMGNQWLRQTFAEASDGQTVVADAQLPTGATTPREKITEHMRSAERMLTDMEGEVAKAGRVEDENGTIYLETRGWSQSDTDRLAGRLQALTSALNRYGLINSLSPGLPSLGQLNIEDERVEIA